MTPLERAEFVRGQMPAAGLFADKSWRVSPSAFVLGAEHLELLERMGRLLHQFNQSCNLLYRQSVAGKQPAWVAELLDRGKPPELIRLARDEKLKMRVPAVIRPDLVMTEKGFALCELDSVPGGIGLTAWLQETYTGLGDAVLGGRSGMRDGFQAIFPEGDIVVSDEAESYRPEMRWLAGEERVKRAEDYTASGRPIYRFFECFDWERLPGLQQTWTAETPMTPPLKPYLEEKLWLALFWARPLQEFWRRELSERSVKLLQQVIPYSWVVENSSLPWNAVIPELGVQRWEELGGFSQKNRELVLKISGFSPEAWGSRGVSIGSDMPGVQWAQLLQKAQEDAARHPYVLQRFIKGHVFQQDYLDDAGAVVPLNGRARVCPYYFVAGDDVRLGGVLVTFCPADKKLLHGMSEAILSPGATGA